MPYRFFCPHLPPSGQVTLTDTEAHHLIHVLRCQPNEVIELFNGDGLVAACRIATIRKRDVELGIQSSRQDPSPSAQLTIATAVPKGDRFDWLIEKATELGVERVIPLVTSQSSVDPRSGKLDKLRQTVIAACKQSGRNHLLQISSVTSWADCVNQLIPEYRTLVAHPNGARIGEVETKFSMNERPQLIVIGPEGGFRDSEVESAQAAGAITVSLGPRILRIETAAIAVASRLLV